MKELYEKRLDLKKKLEDLIRENVVINKQQIKKTNKKNTQ